MHLWFRLLFFMVVNNSSFSVIQKKNGLQKSSRCICHIQKQRCQFICRDNNEEIDSRATVFSIVPIDQ